jgi:hypothetical protein
MVSGLIDELLSLTSDPESRLRERSWQMLGTLALMVARGRQGISDTAMGDEKRVRKACFRSLNDEMVDAGTIRAVIEGCQNLSDEPDCQAALEALQSLAADACRVAAIDSGVLQPLVKAIDNPTLSKRTRQMALSVLQVTVHTLGHDFR